VVGKASKSTRSERENEDADRRDLETVWPLDPRERQDNATVSAQRSQVMEEMRFLGGLVMMTEIPQPRGFLKNHCP
jgi:hypothetical protein